MQFPKILFSYTFQRLGSVVDIESKTFRFRFLEEKEECKGSTLFVQRIISFF